MIRNIAGEPLIRILESITIRFSVTSLLSIFNDLPFNCKLVDAFAIPIPSIKIRFFYKYSLVSHLWFRHQKRGRNHQGLFVLKESSLTSSQMDGDFFS